MDRELIVAAWRRAWEKPDRRPIYEFARSSVNIQGDYVTKGFFRVESSRYLIKPFDAAKDDSVRMINLLKAIQTGGSMLGDVFFQYVLKNQPAPMMMTYQSDDDGEQHYLTRIEPTLRASECNRDQLDRLKKKRDLYQFPAQNLYIQGANMNSLQRKSVRYEINDEVWDWHAGMLGEAWGRTEGFAAVCKIFNISQGGEEKTDWDYCYHNAQRHDWGAHCLRCGHLQPLAFLANMLADPNARAGVIWDDIKLRDGSGRRDIDRSAATARFRCRKCAHEHPDEPMTWERFNLNGDYLNLDPDKISPNRSFHWESMVNGRYHALVSDFLRAVEIKEQGSTAALKKFFQKKLARMWSESAAQEKLTLRTDEYLREPVFADKNYKPSPILNEAHRFITADFQEGRGNDTRHFRVTARAWRKDGSSRLLWEGRCNNAEKVYELQTALGVKSKSVCVDGGHARLEVAAWCARYGWTVLIGDDPITFPHKSGKPGAKPLQRPFSPRFKLDPQRGKAGEGQKFAWAFYWSNPSVKSVTWNLRHGQGPRWEIMKDVSKAYVDEIDSEIRKREIDKKSGSPKWRWVQFKEANHAWDCENMQTVCALIAGILPFDAEEPTPQPENPDAPDAKKQSTEKPSAPHEQPQQLTLIPE